MAFPTPIPANGTVHTEGGLNFVVVNGRWRERPDCRIFRKEFVDVSATSTPVEHDSMTGRIRVHVAFTMHGDGSVQFNVDRSTDNHWLSMWKDSECSGHSANLTNGEYSWKRTGDWKSIKAPNTHGYWLNWADTGWACGHNQNHYCQINIQEYNTEWSMFQWLIVYYKKNEMPAMVTGAGSLKTVPSEISHFAFSTDASFHLLTAVTEAY